MVGVRRRHGATLRMYFYYPGGNVEQFARQLPPSPGWAMDVCRVFVSAVRWIVSCCRSAASWIS
jgi:hypothetical protein